MRNSNEDKNSQILSIKENIAKIEKKIASNLEKNSEVQDKIDLYNLRIQLQQIEAEFSEALQRTDKKTSDTQRDPYGVKKNTVTSEQEKQTVSKPTEKRQSHDYSHKIHQTLSLIADFCVEREDSPVKGLEKISNKVVEINKQDIIHENDMNELKEMVDGYNEKVKNNYKKTEDRKKFKIPNIDFHRFRKQDEKSVKNTYKDDLSMYETKRPHTKKPKRVKNDNIERRKKDFQEVRTKKRQSKNSNKKKSNKKFRLAKVPGSKTSQSKNGNKKKSNKRLHSQRKSKKQVKTHNEDYVNSSNKQAKVNNPEDFFYTHPGVDVKIDIDLTSSLTTTVTNKEEVSTLLKEYLYHVKEQAIHENQGGDSVQEQTNFNDWLKNSKYNETEYKSLGNEKIVASIDKAKATFSETLRTNADLQNLYSTQPIAQGYFQFKNGSYDGNNSTYKVRSKVRFSFAGGPRKAAESLITEGLACTGLPATFNITGEQKIQKEKIKEIAKICEERGINPEEIKIKSDFGEKVLNEITQQTFDPNGEKKPLCNTKVKGGLAHAYVEEYKGEVDIKKGKITPEAMKFYENHKDDFSSEQSQKFKDIQNNKKALDSIGNDYSMFSFEPTNIVPLSEQQKLDIASGEQPSEKLDNHQIAAVAQKKFDGNMIRKDYMNKNNADTIAKDIASNRFGINNLDTDPDLQKTVTMKVEENSKSLLTKAYAVIFEKPGDQGTAQSVVAEELVSLGASPQAANNAAAEAVSTVYSNSKTNEENLLQTVNTKVNVSVTQPGDSSVVRKESLNRLSKKIENQQVQGREVAKGIINTATVDQNPTNKQNPNPNPNPVK